MNQILHLTSKGLACIVIYKFHFNVSCHKDIGREVIGIFKDPHFTSNWHTIYRIRDLTIGSFPSSLSSAIHSQPHKTGKERPAHADRSHFHSIFHQTYCLMYFRMNSSISSFVKMCLTGYSG